MIKLGVETAAIHHAPIIALVFPFVNNNYRVDYPVIKIKIVDTINLLTQLFILLLYNKKIIGLLELNNDSCSIFFSPQVIFLEFI